jgi:hypothetical protein
LPDGWKQIATHQPNLHEYQKKRLREFAFRKRLIPKGEHFVVLGLAFGRSKPEKEKREQSSRAPNVVIYKVKYFTNRRKVKSEFLG